MILKQIQFNYRYEENQEKIKNIIKVHNGINYKEAEEEYFRICKEERIKFDNESRCIIEQFQYELGRYDGANCKKVCIDCKPRGNNWVSDSIEGIISVGYTLKYQEFEVLDEYEKKKLMLKILEEAFQMLQQEHGWDLEPVNKAIKAIKEKDYFCEGQYLKTKTNRSRNYKAKLLFNFYLDKVELILGIYDKNDIEVKRVKMIDGKTQLWEYEKYLGDIKWLDNDIVAVYNKNKEIYWCESIENINNNKSEDIDK